MKLMKAIFGATVLGLFGGLLFTSVPVAEAQVPKEAFRAGWKTPKELDKHFPRGAKPSPRAALIHAPRFVPPFGAPAIPAFFGTVPKQLSYWLNNVDGDCVTAEEAFAKAVYSLMMGGPELFIPDAVVQAWANTNGYLNGAELTDVMNSMQKSGFPVNGVTYNDGPYASVDWTTNSLLSTAIYSGPVKIGVASSQFDNVPGCGTNNGWFMTGFKKADPSEEDHCVGLCGYGTIGQCFQLLGVPVPAGANASAPGYLLFTWSTVGVIDQPSMLAVTFEAWERTPTTPGMTPTPTPVPTPIPTPTPTPTPTPGPITITLSGVVPAGTYTLAPAGTAIISPGTTLAQLGTILTEFANTPSTTPPFTVIPRAQAQVDYLQAQQQYQQMLNPFSSSGGCSNGSCALPTSSGRVGLFGRVRR